MKIKIKDNVYDSKIEPVAEDNVNQYNSIPDTEKHIEKVREYINKIIIELKERAEEHDKSKLESFELEIFNEVTPKLKGLTYGSSEYAVQLERMGEALKHHYRVNRHHPEHYIAGVSDMTLVDLVEMFCDWCAATHRHADGDIVQSIYYNQNRFNLDPTLSKIMLNTSAEYRMGQRKSDDKCCK